MQVLIFLFAALSANEWQTRETATRLLDDLRERLPIIERYVRIRARVEKDQEASWRLRELVRMWELDDAQPRHYWNEFQSWAPKPGEHGPWEASWKRLPRRRPPS